MMTCLLAGAAAAPAFSRPELITGAKIDEAAVQTTLHVQPGRGPHRTLKSAFDAAHRLLVQGTPVRIKIAPGAYREAVLGLDWRQGKAAETTLIVEGAKGVVWTGSDVFPLAGWTKDGGILSHPWPHKFGNFAWSWGPKRLIGHRTELAFMDGRPLMPRILERWEITGIKQDPAVVNQVDYRFAEKLDPAKVLQEGEFGVYELDENGPRVFVRPHAGKGAGPQQIELAVRDRLLDMDGKHNLVLRGIVFQHCANSDREYGYINPVTFGGQRGRPSRNVLIDNCQFLWNSGTGLSLMGQDWTIRNSRFNYNGFSGIATGISRNVLWEDNETSFNVWRAWRGGEIGYFTGGFKAHEIIGHRIEGHTALGNTTMGAWWDVHCKDLFVSDMVLVDNSVNLQYELSAGPFVADRLLMAGGRGGDGMIHMWGGPSRLTNSILWTNYQGGGDTVLYGYRTGERDDPHSRMELVPVALQEVSSCLFVGGPNVKGFAMMDDSRKPASRAAVPATYLGTNNVFWHPDMENFHAAWVGDTARKPGEAQDIAEWMKAGHWQEKGARRLDPRLTNPAEGDFRFAPGSPLYGQRSKWPQVKLTAAQRKAMAEFFAWSGFTPDRWIPLPPE